MSTSGIDTRKVLKFMFRESFIAGRLWPAMLLMLTSSITMNSVIPYLISSVLSRLATQQTAHIERLLLTIIGVAIVGIIANRIGFVMFLSRQIRGIERIQNQLLESLLSKSQAFYSNNMSGKLISDSFGLSGAFVQFGDLLVVNFIPFLFTLVTGLVIVGLQSPILALGLLIMCTIVIGTAIRNSRRQAPIRYATHEAKRQLHGYFADVITNHLSVKIFARETDEQREHNKLNREFSKLRLQHWRLGVTNGNNRIIAILTMQVLFVSLLIIMIQRDPSLLSVGIFAFGFTITLGNKMFEISGMIRNLESATSEAYAGIALLEDEPEITDQPNAPALKTRGGQIDFSNVNFFYDEQSHSPLFNGLSLSIKAGERVGLIGRSGGGKTTVTKLLLRFVDIQGGAIKIDDQDISKVTQQSLRDAIAYVPQEPLLFHRTLAENIAYGKPGATKEEIEGVAKMAHAHEFIKDLPQGYDTLVGERGVKLSGGQRQRVAIARAMLKNAPILLLDEATSALDSESELLIQDALWKLMKGRTAIVIAHRLSTIQKMDRIIVMDSGKIIEQGSHKELLAHKGIYADLWNHQSGGFIDE